MSLICTISPNPTPEGAEDFLTRFFLIQNLKEEMNELKKHLLF